MDEFFELTKVSAEPLSYPTRFIGWGWWRNRLNLTHHYIDWLHLGLTARIFDLRSKGTRIATACGLVLISCFIENIRMLTLRYLAILIRIGTLILAIFRAVSTPSITTAPISPLTGPPAPIATFESTPKTTTMPFPSGLQSPILAPPDGDRVFRSLSTDPTNAEVVVLDTKRNGFVRSVDRASRGYDIEQVFFPIGPATQRYGISTQTTDSTDSGLRSVHVVMVMPATVKEISFAPSDPNVVYAETDGSVLYRSNYAGLTWRLVVNDLHEVLNI